MITDIFFSIIQFFVGLITGTLAIINVILPHYFLTGMADIFRGPLYLNSILPMYPHPEMQGIASETGIMPLFGWLITVLLAVVVLKMVYMVIRIVVGFFVGNISEAGQSEE